MSKLGYTKRSRGGQYKQRSAGDDRQATASEQLIIKYLDETRKEQKSIRNEQLTDLRGVFNSEAKNREQLHTLENQLRDSQKKNTEILAKRDVKRLEDLAKQKEDEAIWWEDFSPTLAENTKKVAQGAWDFVSYHHDKKKLEDAAEQEKAAIRERAKDEATTAIQGNAQQDQFKLQSEGDWEAERKIDEDIWGVQTQPLWGDKFTMEQAKRIEENWDMVVSEAMGDTRFENQTADLIIARLGQIKKHLGIGAGTAGDRHIDRVAKARINAWRTARSQKIAVRKSKERIDRAVKHYKNIKANWDTADETKKKEMSQAVNALVLAYNGRHELTEKGDYISPAMRGSNIGQSFDHMIEDMIKNNYFDDWADLDNMFQGHIPAGPEFKGKDYNAYLATNPSSWEKKRGPDKRSYFKNLFTLQNTAKLKDAQKSEQGEIDGKVLDIKDQLTNKDNPDFLDVNDYAIGGGRQKIWGLYYKPGQHPDVRKELATALSYDPKSSTLQSVHEKLTRSSRHGDFVEFMDAYKFLTPTQQLHYQPDFERLRILQAEGITPQALKKTVDTALKNIPELNYNPLNKKQHTSFERALEAGQQLFYYNLGQKNPKDYKGNYGKLITDVRVETLEQIKDPTGLFRVGKVSEQKGVDKDLSKFVNFDDEVNKQKISGRYIAEKKIDGTYPDIQKLMENEEIFSEKETEEIVEALLNGRDNIPLPETLKDIIQTYPENKATIEKVINTWLQLKGIDVVTMPPQQRTLAEWRMETENGKTLVNTIKKGKDVASILAAFEIKDKFGVMPSPNSIKSYIDKIPPMDAYIKESGNAYEIDPITSSFKFSDPESAIRSGLFRYDPYTHTFSEKEGWYK
tara:strand:- start:1593 stop:4157 length:2565 start_codon:yes stop_codon:yes gene_type:complete